MNQNQNQNQSLELVGSHLYIKDLCDVLHRTKSCSALKLNFNFYFDFIISLKHRAMKTDGVFWCEWNTSP